MGLNKIKIDNGETIGYRERTGGEQTLILIHGNMMSSKHWDLLIDELDEEYTIYAPDLRGFGISSYHKKFTSIKDFSDDLGQFVDRLSLKKFSLLGWSTGGAVAMQFAITNPQLVEKIILLASVSTRGYPFFATNEKGLLDVNNRLETYEDIQADSRTKMMQHFYDTKKREELKKVWNQLIYTGKRPDNEKFHEYIDDMLTQRNLAEVYDALNKFNISAEHNGMFAGTDEAKLIKTPVLNLYGENDLVVTRRMTDEITADLKDCVEAVKLKACGHSPIIDDLPQLTRAIEMFLTS